MGPMKTVCVLITLFSVGALALTGCATGHCRGKHPAGEKHVYIYKPDGSKQCAVSMGAGANNGVPLEQMAAELVDVQVFSKETRLDGKMHPALCGSPTGRLNVYEIGESDIEKSKLYGFQVLAPPAETVAPAPKGTK